VNPRAVAAFIVGIAPNMPGLAAVCGAKGVPNGAKYLYSLSWLVSILLASAVYYALFKLFPFPVDDAFQNVIQGEEVRTSLEKEIDDEKEDANKLKVAESSV